MCFAQAGGRRNLGRGPVRQRKNDRGGEQKCKAVANRLRKIRRVPAERIPLTPSRAHATPQSNASFETKHRPPAAFPELLSFTQRRSTNVTLRELNRARCGSVVAAVSAATGMQATRLPLQLSVLGEKLVLVASGVPG